MGIRKPLSKNWRDTPTPPPPLKKKVHQSCFALFTSRILNVEITFLPHTMALELKSLEMEDGNFLQKATARILDPPKKTVLNSC